MVLLDEPTNNLDRDGARPCGASSQAGAAGRSSSATTRRSLAPSGLSGASRYE